MFARIRLVVGILLLLLGAVEVVMFARVLSTFLLEIVMQTIDIDQGQEIPPYEFSWGLMEWGNMTRDFAMVAGGLVLIGIGQLLVVPPAVVRGGSKLQRGALIGAAVMTLVAGVSFFIVPFTAMRVFGMLATTGAADPVFMGESMAVRASQVFAVCLAAAQLLLMVGVLAGGRGDAVPAGRPAGRLMLVRAAGTCVLVFALAIVIVGLGPVRMMADYHGSVTAADPAKLAGLIMLALRAMLFASPMLVISGILCLIAGVLLGPRPDLR